MTTPIHPSNTGPDAPTYSPYISFTVSASTAISRYISRDMRPALATISQPSRWRQMSTHIRSESMKLPTAFALGSLLASASGCGDCVDLGVTRLSETERTVAVGQSFVATYEQGGVCNDTFRPVPSPGRWSSTDSTIVQVDSATGRVTGKRIGDATVVPGTIDPKPLSLLVHVR